jgi:hypothetical protein
MSGKNQMWDIFFNVRTLLYRTLCVNKAKLWQLKGNVEKFQRGFHARRKKQTKMLSTL